MVTLGTLRLRYGHRRPSGEPPFGWRIARLRARVRVRHERRKAENLGALVAGLGLGRRWLEPRFPPIRRCLEAADLLRPHHLVRGPVES